MPDTPQPIADADKRAQGIEDTFRNLGAKEALVQLQTEMASDMKKYGNNPAGFDLSCKYFQELTEKLEKDHVLPSLSIEWAKDPNHKTLLNFDEQTAITDKALNNQIDRGLENIYDEKANLGAYDRMMIEGLGQNFDHKNLDQAKVEELTKCLLQVQPDGKTLMEVLAKSGDDFVSRDGLDDFLNEAKKNHAPPYTAENVALVQKLRDSWGEDGENGKKGEYYETLRLMRGAYRDSSGQLIEPQDGRGDRDEMHDNLDPDYIARAMGIENWKDYEDNSWDDVLSKLTENDKKNAWIRTSVN